MTVSQSTTNAEPSLGRGVLNAASTISATDVGFGSSAQSCC